MGGVKHWVLNCLLLIACICVKEVSKPIVSTTTCWCLMWVTWDILQKQVRYFLL
jgi:hypothetical protein